MNKDKDDFFGLKTINEENPLTEFAHFQRQQRDKSKESTASIKGDRDLFERHFFPELAEQSESKEGKTSKTEKQSYFDEHFFASKTSGPQFPNSSPNFEKFELPVAQRKGLEELQSLIDPVWKFNKEELVDYMAERVIYETDDFIALDKPYQMAYSSGPKKQAQLDRILHSLKRRISPGTDRLHLLTPLDKACSGIVLFAKSAERQREFKKLLDEDHFLFRFRCLCTNIPKEDKFRINIPLIKVVRDSNVKLCPLIGTASKDDQLFHLTTDCKLINENRVAQVCLIDAFAKRSISHQVRSHLYYGLNCPIVGDSKYARAHLKYHNVLPAAISQRAMDALAIRKNDIRRKMPMFMHLAEVQLPKDNGRNFSLIRSEIPPFFAHALKRLKLLRK